MYVDTQYPDTDCYLSSYPELIPNISEHHKTGHRGQNSAPGRKVESRTG